MISIFSIDAIWKKKLRKGKIFINKYTQKKHFSTKRQSSAVRILVR